MPESHQLIIKQPISALNGALNIDCKEFFASVAKSLIAGISGQTSTSVEYGVDALKEIGLKDKPEHVAWQLVISSFLNSFTKVAEEFKDLFTTEINEADITDLTQRIDHLLNNVEVSVDSNFFERPQDLNLFEEFKPTLSLLLTTFGMNQYQAESLQIRLKGQFVLSLNKTWSKNQEKYKCIIEAINTPFTSAVHHQISWNNYSHWLKLHVNPRVFNEAFNLEQVYIPLRAYYEKTGKDNDKHVCDLHKTIHRWLNQFDKERPIKVISGGPGSGKSSFAKIITGEILDKKIAPVIFIPLHHLKMSQDLKSDIKDYIGYTTYLKKVPLDKIFSQKELIFIFDGLDELSEQGQSAKAAAEQFIIELNRIIELQNNDNYEWRAIVTGRALSIQANQHNLSETEILHLLPYCLTREEKKSYQGDPALLNIDQCNLWWEKFGKANGLKYMALPAELSKNNLFLITREPLLNYLVALNYVENKIQFNQSTNLNTIYHNLLKGVHERSYADATRQQGKGAKTLKIKDFLAILEEIAIEVWHGNGRTASKDKLLKRCKKAKLGPQLDRFSNDSKRGLIKLLTAFYFREFETIDIEPTYEFTHKSFAEYLTAKHIVRFALKIDNKVSDGSWSDVNALEKWIKLTGPTLIDLYLFNFIKNELTLIPKNQQRSLQKTFIKLLGKVINDGSPMQQKKLNFSEMLVNSANAETALLAIHSACAQNTLTTIKIDFKNNFGSWMRRVNATLDNATLKSSLQYLDLSSENLRFSLFTQADLSKSTLNESNLAASNFMFANLSGAILRGSSLRDANFKVANLANADLSDSNLTNSNFTSSNLSGAVLTGVNISGADFASVNLTNATITDVDFKKTNLVGANFTMTNLSKVSLRDTRLVAAAFIETNLEEANLQGADLRSANFDSADLTKANLSGADLTKAKFKHAYLINANLRGANLTNTNFLGANLKEADLRGAILEGANFFGASTEGAKSDVANLNEHRLIVTDTPN